MFHFKGKGEKTKCGKYRGVRLLSVVGKIYVWILVDKVSRVADDEQGGFRSGSRCVNQNFNLK